MKPVHVSRPHRAYDHLYDPVYTVSSEIDHARSEHHARVRKVPDFGSMFSSLPHHPRFTLRLNATDSVPAFIDRRWRGRMERRKEALQQLAGVLPGVQFRSEMEETCVTGADRWKYFKRPLIPFAQQIPHSVIFALPKDNFSSLHGKNADKQPTHVTVGVQTDYRESEAQTDPYSPGYVVKSGPTVSELLTLASLTSGHGLPAGLAEVEMIEHARAKRAWEATLPPLDDLSQLEKRKRMMEEMEINDWAFRDEQIQKLQEARLAVLRDLLRQREGAQKEVTSERLNQVHAKKQQSKEAKLQKIHKDYITSLRQILAKRRKVEGKLERGDVVLDYTRYCSRTYAPLTSKGASSKWKTQTDVGKNRYLDTYEGLLELEAGLSTSDLKPRVKTLTPKLSKGLIIPSERKEIEMLQKFQALMERKDKGTKKTPLRCLAKVEKPAPRPATPKVEEPAEGAEERELAVIHLQRVLRGRSTQYQMFKGKERHLDLIQEMRSVHALQRDEEELKRAEKEHTENLKKQRDLHTHRTSQEESFQAGVVGSQLQHLFDTLNKEMVHLQEERRIHAFVLLAEREFRLRNAAESGRRQVEERRRKEADEIFKQVIQVHQDTVDCFLEDIILETVEQRADQQAREEIHRMAQEVNDLTYAVEESRNNLQSEEIVSELVYGFLIPETQRDRVRQSVHQKQRKHMQAARRIIQGSEERPDHPSGLNATPPPGRASSQVLGEVTEPESRDSTGRELRDD
ncbi:cilia- and flagella-associated protein 91 [Genypterus blacodes]|uniref:cilia- and flagella-associated protein 91 n=1 Tax=Genypterus blacodes TaxID=154954 RepID=UPI003F75F951